MASFLQFLPWFNYVQFIAFATLIFGAFIPLSQFFKERQRMILILGGLFLIYSFGMFLGVLQF